MRTPAPLLVFLVIAPASVHASLAAFEFTAHVSGFSSLGGSTAWVDPSIMAGGALVSGRFVFDPQTVDSFAPPDYGRYFVDAETNPGAGFQSLTVGPYTVGGGQIPGHAANYCAIDVQDSPALRDSLVVEEKWMFASGGMVVPTMGAASFSILTDGPSDALGSDGLPTNSPDLSKFIDKAGWIVLVPPAGGGWAVVNIDFELETLTAVPGPGVLAGFGAMLGCCAVQRRRS